MISASGLGRPASSLPKERYPVPARLGVGKQGAELGVDVVLWS